MKGNWGATVCYGRQEHLVPTSFGLQPEWAKEEDDDEVMGLLADIKRLGYKYPDLEGYPWERARVEHSLLVIDAVPGGLFFFVYILFFLLS